MRFLKLISVMALLFMTVYVNAQFQFTERDFYYSQPNTERQVYGDHGSIDRDKGDPGSTVPEGWGPFTCEPIGDPVVQTGGSHRSKNGHWSGIGKGNAIENGGIGTWCWTEDEYGWYQDYWGNWHFGWHEVIYHQDYLINLIQEKAPLEYDVPILLVCVLGFILMRKCKTN